jgi:hypothetical protein
MKYISSWIVIMPPPLQCSLIVMDFNSHKVTFPVIMACAKDYQATSKLPFHQKIATELMQVWFHGAPQSNLSLFTLGECILLRV